MIKKLSDLDSEERSVVKYHFQGALLEWCEWNDAPCPKDERRRMWNNARLHASLFDYANPNRNLIPVP